MGPKSRHEEGIFAAPRIAIGLVLLVVVSCSAPQFDRRPLYEQLGGERGVSLLVDGFLRELALDPKVAHHFKGIDVARFRAMLAEHLCEVSEGPCRYSGASMSEAHRGMAIGEGDFNATVEALIRAMENLRVATPIQNRLLRRLAPMRADIMGSSSIEKPTNPEI